MEVFLPFPQQLRLERLKRGWRQADLAEKIGCDTKTVASWERGKSLPNHKRRRQLSTLFGKSIGDFGLAVTPARRKARALPSSAQHPEQRSAEWEAEREQTASSEEPTPPSLRAYRSILGFPPVTSPTTIHQRINAVEELCATLQRPDITAIVLTGIAGVGKSTLAALVYAYVRDHSGTRSGSLFPLPPLWLTIDANTTLTDITGTLLEALDCPLPEPGSLFPHQQIMTMLQALCQQEAARLIVLDQCEQLLDWQTGAALPEHPGIGEWLDALNSHPCACKWLLTGRPWPQGTHNYPPTYMQEWHVPGLSSREGVELLRKQGIREQQATDNELETATLRCSGHAQALVYLASLLRFYPGPSLSAFLTHPLYFRLWSGNIARNFLDHIYLTQLTETQRNILSLFSLYREAVPLEACLELFEVIGKEREMVILESLQALLVQHMIIVSENACYSLHEIVRHYLKKKHDIQEVPESRQKRLRLHARAAGYYLRQVAIVREPGEREQRPEALHPFIEAVYQFCQAEQWQQAYTLVRREGLYYLLRQWSSNLLLLDLYQQFLPLAQWKPELAQEAEIHDQLGRIYGLLGNAAEALRYGERALRQYQALADPVGESRSLHHLGLIYENLGRFQQAGEVQEQALLLARSSGEEKIEADCLNSLGWIYHQLGQQEEAIHCCKMARAIQKATGNRLGESNTLHNLGMIFSQNGQPEQALTHYYQALTIRQAIGNRVGEGKTLNQLGLLYTHLRREEQAYQCYRQSLRIRKETGDRAGEGTVLYNLGKLLSQMQHNKLALACLLLARSTIADSLQASQAAIEKQIAFIQQVVGPETFASLESDVKTHLAQLENDMLLLDTH